MTRRVVAATLAALSLAAAGQGGVIENFNSMLERGRRDEKDVFLLVVSPVGEAEAFARLLASEEVRASYKDRYLGFPVYLGDFPKIPPDQRARTGALLELYQAEPGPHPLFVFVRPDGIAYRHVRPTLSSEGPRAITAAVLKEVFEPEAVQAERARKAAFDRALDVALEQEPATAARELDRLLGGLSSEQRRLPAGRKALGRLLELVEEAEAPELVAIRQRWQPVALRDAQRARLWQVRRLAWTDLVQDAIEVADEICDEARDPEIRREGCLSSAHLLVTKGTEQGLVFARERLQKARQASVELGEAADAPDPVTGLPGPTPAVIDGMLETLEEKLEEGREMVRRGLGIPISELAVKKDRSRPTTAAATTP